MSTAVSEGTRINDCTVRLTRDDLTDLHVDALVFYASHDLELGAGYGTALSIRGGPTIQAELEGLAPLETGQAVATGGGKLAADYVVHAVGPRFQEPDLEDKLRRTMDAALTAAEARGVRRIAFPPMGAGYYGIPPNLCARIMFESLAAHLAGESGLDEVIVAVLDARQHETFQAELAAMAEGGAP